MEIKQNTEAFYIGDRFEEALAKLEFENTDYGMILTHTEVSEELKGQGVGREHPGALAPLAQRTHVQGTGLPRLDDPHLVWPGRARGHARRGGAKTQCRVHQDPARSGAARQMGRAGWRAHADDAGRDGQAHPVRQQAVGRGGSAVGLQGLRVNTP